jgi:hypothetical protein
MSLDRRRAGFRLPWSPEGEDGDSDQATTSAGADDAVRSEPGTPPAEGADGSGEASAPAAGPEEAAITDVSNPSGDPDSSEFLRSLVGAMRGVAESSRDASLADLRGAIDGRIEALGTQASQQEQDLRRRAELDLENVGNWEHTEIERVKSEAERKREARRSQLEQQLAEHRTASVQEVEAVRSRLQEHERDLAAFFGQLGEITDPAAFVAAAKRMPHAPELTGSATPVAPLAEDPRLAALRATPPDIDAAPVESPVAPDEAGTTEPEPELEPTVSTAAGEANPDNRLAERLAQLDERLSGATQPVAAAAAPSTGTGGDASTPIIVKGLGSFGAITSFKQALERVEGIRGVTLSLGPTGEFVYRASHAGEFDLAAAIQSIEGPTATIEDSEGTMVVTLSRAR